MIRNLIFNMLASASLVIPVLTQAMPAPAKVSNTTNATTQIGTNTIYTESKNQISVTRTHPTFIIQLPSNPTTGYSWEVQPYNQNMIVLVGHRFIAPKPGLMGAPGIEEWTFIAKNNAFKDMRNAEVKFNYARTWEKESVKDVTFTVLFSR